MPIAAGSKLRASKRANSALIVTLASKIESAPGEVPNEFRIFAKGDIRTKKGIFTFDAESAKSVQKHADEWGNEYSLDYNHGAFSFFGSPDSGIAAGWYKLDIRNGELWAVDIEWTPKARAHLEAREYRYFSPTFRHEEGGRIIELLNVALTNVPATNHMKPLMASLVDETTEEGNEEPPMWKTLLAALGLSENASEAEAMAALSKERQLAQTLTALTGKETAQESVAVLQAWKVIVGKYAEQAAELNQLKQDTTKREMDVILADAKRAGKLPPAMEPLLRNMELSAAKAFIEAMPAVVKGSPTKEAPAGQGDTQLSSAELEVCRLTGTSEADFLKMKAQHKGQVPVGTISKPGEQDEE